MLAPAPDYVRTRATDDVEPGIVLLHGNVPYMQPHAGAHD